MIDIKVTISPANAIKRVKKEARGRKVYVMAHNHAPISGVEGKVFPTLAVVPVSVKDAVRYIADAYGGFAERGALVPLHISERCIFIG